MNISVRAVYGAALYNAGALVREGYEPLFLSHKPFLLAAALLAAQCPLHRRELMDYLYAECPDGGPISDYIICTYITGLRRALPKLGLDIRTEFSIGYYAVDLKQSLSGERIAA